MGRQGGLQDRLFYSFNLDTIYPRIRIATAVSEIAVQWRHVFETVLLRCVTEWLVQGEGLAVDASIIKADAIRSRGVAGTETIDWSKGEAFSGWAGWRPPRAAHSESLASIGDQSPYA